MSWALILVDLQNDFLPGGALEVPDGDQVIPVANRVQPLFEVVVASQDWHPADHGSFAASHPGKQPGEQIELAGLTQILWATHCVQDSEGARLASGLETSRIDRIFYKGSDPQIDSYSCFYDNGHRRSTGLADYLREQRATEVYLLGLATDYCVKFSALDAVAEGFAVHLILDGCRGIDLETGDVDRALDEMREAGVTLKSSSDLLAERADTN
ncbi:MAG: bifunctional nicotinamidase/pyrazinamidase [Thermoanaerobaculia bacterium]